MPRIYNEHVSHYSEETNAENNAGIVAYLYRIVPHIHSAVFSALYMCKKSAIEILLRKHKSSFPNARKTGLLRCGYFEVNPQAYISEDNNRRRQGK